MTIGDEKVVASAAIAPPSAPVGVEDIAGRLRNLAAIMRGDGGTERIDGKAWERVEELAAFLGALAQQPAAVDGACAAAAIRFALTDPEGMTFLRLWNEGDFDTLRREWPDAPIEVYVGADPIAAQPGGSDND